LLENGGRHLTPRLAARVVRVFGLSPAALPHEAVTGSYPGTPQQVAEALSMLGYPGFAYLPSRRHCNPADVVLGALSGDNLEARLVEALPWVFLNSPDLDWNWLVNQARLHNLQNRLGFLVSLARAKLEEAREVQSPRYRILLRAEQELEQSRLVREDAFSEALTPREREWLREHRSEPAAHWNVLSNLSPEHLPYAA